MCDWLRATKKEQLETLSSSVKKVRFCPSAGQFTESCQVELLLKKQIEHNQKATSQTQEQQ